MDKTITELKNRFEQLCDENDTLYKPEFEEVFKALLKIDNTLTKDYPCTDNNAYLQEALELSGFSMDEDFCRAFIKYNTNFVEGKRLQYEWMMHPENPMWADIKKQQEKQQQMAVADEWLYIPVNIFASNGLHDMIAKIVETDAKEGEGLFSNVTNIPIEDEEEDELLMIDAFEIKCCLLPYWDELKKFGVIGNDADNPIISKTLRKVFLIQLNSEITFAKDNTQFPSKVKNHIADTLKRFDEIPIFGLLFQILILQGFVDVFKRTPIEKGDEGFEVLQSLFDWICVQTAKKMIDLCRMPFGDRDREELRPFTDYLYQTEIGKEVQQWVKKEFYSKPHPTLPKKRETAEIMTERATFYFEKAIDKGWMRQNENGYEWLYGESRGKVRLAYFLQKIYNPRKT